jgi:23S rRNA (cytosine1962-C5)-methyltransferase
MIELKIHERHHEKYSNHYPLLFKEAIMGNHIFDTGELEEGELLKLTDERGKYMATAYYGRQNKGLGWIITTNSKEKIDTLFFKRKIYQALEKRIGLYNNPKTNAFRVFNGEGDGIGGLQIDFLNGNYLISYYSKGIYKFNSEIVAALSSVVEYDSIYEKKRFEDESESDFDGFVKGKRIDFPLLVKENGVNLNVYFNDGAMIGFFMDQREVRRTLRNNYAKNKTVLNTFSYTGAFSLFAALGGAKKTTSVDLANRSLERTIENFKANAIDPVDHEIIVEDVFHYFKWAQKKNLKYDIVILDPPSFAKSKDFVFNAEKDYPELLANAIAVTKDSGIIIASNNSSTIDMEKFKQLIGKGFNMADLRFEIFESYQLPKDFRTNRFYEYSDYLKVLFIRIKKKG